METVAEYFVIVGLLLLLYCLIHMIFWWDRRGFQRIASSMPSDWKRTGDMGKPIDTSLLSTRVQSVRQAYQTENRPHPMSFKRSLRVESKREEIAQKAFFQKPTPVGPFDEHDQHGPILLLM